MKDDALPGRRWVLPVPALIAIVIVACGSPLVGGRCEPGRIQCDERCVDLERDADHCGGCGQVCAGSCSDGQCQEAASSDAGPAHGVGEPSRTGGSAGAQIDSDPSAPDEAVPDEPAAGTSELDDVQVCDPGFLACGGTCVDLARDSAHCGACDSACAGGEVCEAGTCGPACEPSATRCAGGCFDLTTSELHCGACDRLCASGLCEAGSCVDTVPGHVIVLGHSYRRSNPFQSTLLGNAIFLAGGAPVRVLSYTGMGDPDSIGGANAAIQEVADDLGRSWLAEDADGALLTTQLSEADVLLIHGQPDREDEELLALGEEWSTGLVRFLARGGIVVLLEVPSTANAGSHQLLRAAGLFEAGTPRSAGIDSVSVLAPGVGIAQRVGDRYRGELDTLAFPELVTSAMVVSKAGELPVVVHRIVLP